MQEELSSDQIADEYAAPVCGQRPEISLVDAPADASLILDLDETLWLRNSTEEYLGSVRPRWLVAGVLMMIRIFRLWRPFGRYEDAEDWFRVLVVSCVCPWGLFAWRWRVRTLGPAYVNAELRELAHQRTSDSTVIIATRGFDPVVRPLVRTLGLPSYELVACGLWNGRRDRRRGKRRLLTDGFGDELVAASIVVTDSETDDELLAASAHPMLIRWPEARYLPAPMVYAPFAYTEMFKRAGQNYVFHMVLRDFSLWILATVFVTGLSPGVHLAGLSALLISFWCVYELGYMENDRVAERYEPEPVLPDSARSLPGLAYRATAAMWAMGLGVVGVVLLGGDSLLLALATWFAVLGLVRVVFFVYNHVDKATRPILYGALQILRLAAPIALVPVATAGVIAMFLLAWSRSLLYAVYRALPGTWRSVPHHTIDLVQVTTAYGVLWWAGVPLEGDVVLALVVWFAFVARSEIRRLCGEAHLIRSSRASVSLTPTLE